MGLGIKDLQNSAMNKRNDAKVFRQQADGESQQAERAKNSGDDPLATTHQSRADQLLGQAEAAEQEADDMDQQAQDAQGQLNDLQSQIADLQKQAESLERGGGGGLFG